MEFVQAGKHSHYLLSLDLEPDLQVICIKAESEVQIQNQYSKSFVFKENQLKMFPNSNNFLAVWGSSRNKSVELELSFATFPFYIPHSTQKEYLNKLQFTASKMSLVKEFIQSLFKEKEDSYSWISLIDGNSLSVIFNNDIVQVGADDPVVLSKFLKKLLDWAQVPIIVSSFNLDQDSFRNSSRFWIQELIHARIFHFICNL